MISFFAEAFAAAFSAALNRTWFCVQENITTKPSSNNDDKIRIMYYLRMVNINIINKPW